MGLIAWIVNGLIAGWLAAVMKGGGYGISGDIVLGGIAGGWIFGALGLWHGRGIIGSLIVAFIGAVVLVAITRLFQRLAPETPMWELDLHNYESKTRLHSAVHLYQGARG